MSKTRKSKFIELENEEQIIQDCLDGDMLALEKLTQHYLSYVYRRVWISIPSSDVDDVTQEVFITVVKKITTFRQESKFSTWLFAITQYKIADYYRKSKKQEKDVAIQDPEFKKRIFLIDNNFDAAKIDNLLLLREGFFPRSQAVIGKSFTCDFSTDYLFPRFQIRWIYLMKLENPCSAER